MRIIPLTDTASTNDYLLHLHSDEDLVAVAGYQSAGRGMGTNRWESEPGSNLLFSILIHPTWLRPVDQYVLSMAHALALYDVLSARTEGISIKWPNDIYWQDRKISGTLIEPAIRGGVLADMVIGTGLNVNQLRFLSDAPNPVSLRQITGAEHDLSSLLDEIIVRTQYYVDIAEREYAAGGVSPTILSAYHSHLYRRSGFYTYEDPSGRFEAEIAEVLPHGLLVLRLRDGELRQYNVKQVRFVLGC